MIAPRILHTTAPAHVVSVHPEDKTDNGKRVAEYTRWRDFATGAQWSSRARRGEIRHTYNYARTLVRKVASYVFSGNGPTFQIGAADDDFSAQESWLQQAVIELDLASLDLELEEERSIIGDAAMKVTWDPIAKRPRVVAVDPFNLVAHWSADNPREAYQVSHTVELPGLALLPVLAARPELVAAIDPVANYIVTEHWTDLSWQIVVHGVGSHSQANPYGWIPYVILPNNPLPRQFWGRSDLIDIEEPAKAFNSEMTLLDQIMTLSGFPIAVLENVDGTDGIRVAAGAKWELPEGAKAYLLDLLAGTGVQMHINYLDQLRTTLHDLSETPRTAFGDTGRAVSGAALEVEIQPLVQRVGRKRRGWDRGYRQRNRMLLDLAAANGLIAGVPADKQLSTIWPSVLPSDFTAETQNNVSLVAAGIRSRVTASRELGDPDPEAEMQRVDDEHQAASERTIAEARASRPAPGEEDQPEGPESAREREEEPDA